MPFEKWIRESVSGRVEQTLNNDALCTRVGLSPHAVKSLWDAYQSGAPGMYWSRPWSLFILLDWCQTHDMSVA